MVKKGVFSNSEYSFLLLNYKFFNSHKVITQAAILYCLSLALGCFFNKGFQHTTFDGHKNS